MVSAFDSIYGNERLKQNLISDIKNNKMSQAYMIEGKDGSGKFMLASMISAAISCENKLDPEFNSPCMECINCKKIIGNSSPDIITIDLPKDRKSIGIDSIRTIKDSLYIKANELDNKVYIINNAHLMTPQAQNALLKVLEEPPLNVLFLLLCENSTNLLITVKSRLITLRMQNFTESEITDFLINKLNNKKAKDLLKTDINKFKLILKISDGCIGTALEHISAKKTDKYMENYIKAENILSTLCGKDSKPNKGEFLLYMSNAASKREELSEILTYLLYELRDIILFKKGIKNNNLFFRNEAETESLSSFYNTESIMQLSTKIEHTKISLSTNVNIQIALLDLANEMWKTKN